MKDLKTRAEAYGQLFYNEYGCEQCQQNTDEAAIAHAYLQGAKDARRWVSVEEDIPKNTLLVGEFEVEPSYFSTPLIVFQVKDGKYFDQGGSHLSPEYRKLIHWQPLPPAPEMDDE